MPDISSIGQGSVGPVNRMAASSSASDSGVDTTDSSINGRLSDSVEVSDHAQFLNRLRLLPEVRMEVVERVRAAIAEGTYETEERLNIAIDRLLDDLEE